MIVLIRTGNKRRKKKKVEMSVCMAIMHLQNVLSLDHDDDDDGDGEEMALFTPASSHKANNALRLKMCLIVAHL